MPGGLWIRGADIIVAHGWESGSHVRGDVATMALLPRVVDAGSPVPVISAGSIVDGRGMAAAFVLGADGVWIGTRFLASEESTVDQSYKERLLQATETGTLFPRVFNGGWDATGRVLRNSTVEMWEAAGRPESGLRLGEGEVIAKGANGEPVERYSAIAPYTDVTGDLEGLSNWAGQGVGLVNRIQPATDIVKEIAEEAVQVMRKANGRIRE